MRKFVKALLIAVAVVAIGFYILANHSLVRTTYACTGELIVEGKSSPEAAYVAFDRYRWWLIWGDSDGSVHFELSNGIQQYYSGLDAVSTGWHIYLDRVARGIPDGLFSTLSNTLRITMVGNIAFEGVCTER